MRYKKGEEWTMKVHNFEEVKEKVEQGLPFRILGEDWIYKAEMNPSLPEGVFAIRKMHKQSVFSMRKMFCKFETVDDPERKILIGKDHENLILKEVGAWARDVNEKGKAYSGCDFMSYLRAIPFSILSSGDFLERLVSTLDDNFDEKLKHVRGKDLKEKYEQIHENAVKFVCNRVQENPRNVRNNDEQISFFDILDREK